MTRFGRTFHLRVRELVEHGQRLHGSGDVPAAIDRYRQARALLREAVEAEPAYAQGLGSTLYMLGEWEFNSGDHAAAIETLTEAESTYSTFGRGDVTQLVADVVIRRARVCAAAGRPLSAISDAQQAVTTCLAHLDDSRRLGAARVIAHAASVQLSIGGDPDLAVGAADWALREYLTAFRTGDRLALPAVHAPPVQAAGRVAYVVHSAFDRTDLAEAARWFATVGDGGAPFHPDPIVERVRAAQPTLARVLDQRRSHRLKEMLTAPATEVTLLVPAMRCDPQLAAPLAAQLVDVQQTNVGSDRIDLLLGLEAHAMFAAASQQGVPSLRYQFGQFGPLWATAVMTFGQRQATQRQLPAAVDAANWLTGIVGQLVPHAMIDARARGTALSCARWQHAIYTAAGDRTAAENVTQAITALEAFAATDN